MITIYVLKINARLLIPISTDMLTLIMTTNILYTYVPDHLCIYDNISVVIVVIVDAAINAVINAVINNAITVAFVDTVTVSSVDVVITAAVDAEINDYYAYYWFRYWH